MTLSATCLQQHWQHRHRPNVGDPFPAVQLTARWDTVGLLASIKKSDPVRNTGSELRCLSGAKGIRTPDLLDANESRYQLRHSP